MNHNKDVYLYARTYKDVGKKSNSFDDNNNNTNTNKKVLRNQICM